MAKPWRDVMASPQYQSLNPQQQAAAQDQYFNEVVAPKAGNSVEHARQQFYAAYPLYGISKEENTRQERVFKEANTFDRFMFGAVKGMMDVANALPWADKPTKEEQAVIDSIKQRMKESDSTSQDIGEFVGQSAPFLSGGGIVNLAGTTTGRMGLASLAGATEGGLVAKGTGGDPLVGATVGGVLGPAAEYVSPFVGKTMHALGEKTGLNKLFRGAEESAGASGQAAQSASQAPSPEETLRQMAAQKQPDLASSLQGLDVQVNPEVRAAADRLRLTEDLLPSHLSGNQQYQAVEQAIKSRAGSALKVQEDSAILRLAENAGRLIDDVAAVPDALSLNQRVIGQFDNRIKALERRSDVLYQQVDNAMPPRTRVEANHTAAALERKADELGGWENLDTIEKNVFKAVNPGAEGILTYANLNKQRRLVGQALFKNRGPYKDADEGALRYLYRQLSEDQRAVLGDVGVGRDFEVAQRLVQMRKNMEDQMVSLRGKNLTGDIANKSSLAVASLAKGNTKQFTELMANLPTRQMRQEVAGASIRDMLSAGKRGADFNPAGFADWYQNLRTSGNLRVLGQYMPREFMTGLHDTYVVANAIRRAKSFEITTGRLGEFTKRFDAVTAPHELMAKYAGKVGTMAGTTLGPLGAVAGGALGEKLAARARMSGGAGSSEAAERLILSPEFQQATKGINTPPAREKSQYRKVFDEARLRTSQQWRTFYDSLPDVDKRTIARIGIIGWINQQEQPESNE
ncbi:hypothetical protein [Xenorhabdus szentirmaii]|uniref:hypothetical protein n=1 Tax=Xenorhabdus szentirmaii TaxID=290112 RepID=UPI0019896B06|nr:hypothetical protein [Xenorhabdus sp. CUL]MBD2791577.1 hypothetical protein [Xenorhabdus sp. CUL]